jgi:hypothetical protein
MDERITDNPRDPEERITDEPPGPDPWRDKPPWERPGGFRLDGQPHRGGLLNFLGLLATVVGGIGLLVNCGTPLIGVVPRPGGLPLEFSIPGSLAFLALPLGLTAAVLARRDLNRMRYGTVDPAGFAKTREALALGITGVILGTLCTALWIVVWPVCLR